VTAPLLESPPPPHPPAPPPAPPTPPPPASSLKEVSMDHACARDLLSEQTQTGITYLGEPFERHWGIDMVSERYLEVEEIWTRVRSSS
jgi:hypothetical protein